MAYVCFWIVADDLHVLNIAVHRTYRRKGIGRILLLCAFREGRVRGATRALLEVRSRNLGARSFYRSLGFQEVGERPGYYGGREAAVLMDLNFQDVSNNRCVHGRAGEDFNFAVASHARGTRTRMLTKG